MEALEGWLPGVQLQPVTEVRPGLVIERAGQEMLSGSLM